MNNEVKLNQKQLDLIKSMSIDKWIASHIKETTLIEIVISSFIGFCNANNLTIKKGKIVKDDNPK